MPSIGTSQWLHAICFSLWKYQCFLWLRSWHQIKSVSHFDSTDLSTDDGRAFLQFPEDMIHAVKVKLHTLKKMTASEHCCRAASVALAANRNSCMQPPALTSTLTPFREKEGEQQKSWNFVNGFQFAV